jgi:hypothetical protein
VWRALSRTAAFYTCSIVNRRERREGGYPVERLQEEARWSGFTNSWNRSFRGGSRRARVFALAWVGVFIAIALIGLVISIIGIASAR